VKGRLTCVKSGPAYLIYAFLGIDKRWNKFGKNVITTVITIKVAYRMKDYYYYYYYYYYRSVHGLAGTHHAVTSTTSLRYVQSHGGWSGCRDTNLYPVGAEDPSSTEILCRLVVAHYGILPPRIL
jgi:hypothetical protein